MADRVQAAGAPGAGFDLDELIAALRQAEQDGAPAGATAQELAERMSMAPQTVRRYLRAGLAVGRVKHVRVRRMRMNGVMALVDGYVWMSDADSE